MTLFFYLLSFSTFLSALIIYGMSFATSLVEMSDSNIRVTLKYRWLAWFRWIAMSIAWAAPPLLIGLPLQNDNGSVNWLTILSIYAIIATIAILGLHSLPGGIKVDQPRFRLSTITLFGIATAAIMTNVGLQLRDRGVSDDSETETTTPFAPITLREPITENSVNISSNFSLDGKEHPTEPLFHVRAKMDPTHWLQIELYDPVNDVAKKQCLTTVGRSSTYVAFRETSIEIDYDYQADYDSAEVTEHLTKKRILLEGPVQQLGSEDSKKVHMCSILLCTNQQYVAYLDSDLSTSREDITQFCRENGIWCFFFTASPFN